MRLAFRVRLANHICGFLVLPEPKKTTVTKVIVRSPFEKLELADQQRREPNTFGHLLCCEALAPPPAPRFRQIHKRARGRLQTLKPLAQLISRCGRETVPRSRDVEQLALLVVAEDQRIECARRFRITADYEFLALVDTHLLPGPGPLPRFIPAV